MNRTAILTLGAVVVLTATTPLYAHHSGTAYDSSKHLLISGTVKDWQWTNPHSWLQVMVDDGKGGTTEAGFELGSPNTLIRNGFSKTSFKAGDKVTVLYGPRKDGVPGGGLEAVLNPEGKWLQWGPKADVAGAEAAAKARAGGGSAPPAAPSN